MAKAAWLPLLCAMLLIPDLTRAQTYVLSPESSADVLTLTFAKKAPPPVVLRTGPRQMEILFPEGTKLGQLPKTMGKGRHIKNLSLADNVLVVELGDESFGFVGSSAGDKAFKLQVFYDPAGARWNPSGPGQEPMLQAKAANGPEPVKDKAEAAKPSQPAPMAPLKSSFVRGAVVMPGRDKPQAAQPATQSATPPAAQPVSQPAQPATSKPTPAKQSAPVAQPIAQPISPPGAQPAGKPAQQPSGSLTQPSQPATQALESTSQIPSQTPAKPLSQPVRGSLQPENQAQTPAQMPQSAQPSPPVKPTGPAQDKAQTEITQTAQTKTAMGPELPQAAATKSQITGPEKEEPKPATPAQPEAQTRAQPPSPAQSPAKEQAEGPNQGEPKKDQAGEESAQAPSKEATGEPGKTTPDAQPVIEAKSLLINGDQGRLKGEYDKSIRLALSVLNSKDMPNSVREEAFYLVANCLFDKFHDNLPDHFDQVNDAYQQALNFNTGSDRVPMALTQLGYLNLSSGYLPEAKAYFSLLKNRYPHDERVALIDLYWGQYYQKVGLAKNSKADLESAVEKYKSLIQNYPESKYKMDAALGLAKCYLELDRYGDADTIIDFIEKIQPRFYVDNPFLRRVSADVSYKLGRYEKARDDYLWYYNLAPDDQTSDMVLARLGDVQAKLGKPDAARSYYETAISLHPGQEGALMAMMRLAEQGIHDSPTIQEMFKTFATPKDIHPDQIYALIVKDYPKSPLAPLAVLKMAMWRLYKKDNLAAMDVVNQFLASYPDQDKDLLKQVIEVGAQAFDNELTPLMAETNYKRISELWRQAPFLADHPDLLPSRDRLAVALSLYYSGEPREALAMAEPYLRGPMNDDSQKAASLCLTIYRESQDWQSILNMVASMGDWKLADNPRRTLEFAQAMALENTGDLAKSRLLWARLAADNQLDPAKRAYAVYYQALTAMDRADYEKALAYAMDAQNLFMEAAKEPGKAQDAMLVVIQANQKLGRYPEAMHWCQEYAKTVAKGTDEWGANHYRMATLFRLMGKPDDWRKSLESVRDTMGNSLYGNMATAELTGRGLEDRAGKLVGRP